LYKSSNNINYYLTSGDDFIVKYGWNIPEKFQDGKLKKKSKKGWPGPGWIFYAFINHLVKQSL